MKCHEILHISERASEEEIILAYEERVKAVDKLRNGKNDLLVGKKLDELKQALEDCNAWKKRSFRDRTVSRLSECVSNVTSPNRMYTVIGLFSACNADCDDACCGGCEGCRGTDEEGICGYCCCSQVPCMLLDVATYVGIVALIIYGISASITKRRKDKEDAWIKLHEEQEKAKEKAKLEVDGILAELSPDSIRRTIEYIGKLPDVVGPEEIGVSKSYIKEYVNNEYKRRIDDTYSNALIDRKFSDALTYITILASVDSNQIYKYSKNKLQMLCSSIDSTIPTIVGNDYWSLNQQYVNSLSNSEEDIAGILDSSLSIGELLWRTVLAHPFDVRRYSTLVKSIPMRNSNGMPTIDVVASLIYVYGSYTNLIGEIDLPFDQLLNELINVGNRETLFSLASIAYNSGNTQTELAILSRLSSVIELPKELRERFNYLSK